MQTVTCSMITVVPEGPTMELSESEMRMGCCFLRRLLKLPTRTRSRAVETGRVF